MSATHCVRPCSTIAPAPYYMSAIWELPFFRNAGGVTKSLLGGWELTGITTLTTGAPFRVFYGTDLWNQGGRSTPVHRPHQGRESRWRSHRGSLV